MLTIYLLYAQVYALLEKGSPMRASQDKVKLQNSLITSSDKRTQKN
jgi:hypothetical protein